MKTHLFLTFACMGLLLPLMAQERSTSGGADVQMNWATLSGQISNLTTQVNDANTQINQLVACGKKGMAYAFGKAGADADGCKILSTPATIGACYQRAGWAGVHVACNSDEVATAVCTSGRDSDCIAPGGTIINTGKSTATESSTGTTKTGSQATYTVLTCCKLQ